MTSQNALRGLALRGAPVAAAAALMIPLAARPALAQSKPAPTGSVLIYPAVIEGVSGESAKVAAEVVTDALRSRLKTLGVGVVIYSGRLSSIQRAREEQQIKREDAENGPLDDRRKAQRMAEIVGASEYLSVFVDGYKFNASTRTATFNLNVNRYLAADGSPMGSFSKAQQGVAPAGVAPSRQEGSAAARAMEVGAEQSVGELYPVMPILDNAKTAPRRKKASSDRGIVPVFGAAIAALFFSTR